MTITTGCWTIRSVTVVALLFMFLVPSAHARPADSRGAQAVPENFALTTASCPVCTGPEQDRHAHIGDDQLGIDALDPTTGRFVGDWPAERNKPDLPTDPFGTDNVWFPQSMKKETLCGTLDHFNFFDGSGDEADWNNFMRPDPEFRRLIDDVAARHGTTNEWHRDSRGRLIMEAEITPDEHYYENAWFPKSSGVSPLEGERVCTYGPWVTDKPHDYRPEIHPSELYWWRSGDQGYLLVLQDDSNRFDRREDFDFDGDPTPSWWRPWSKSPRTATFKIAFSVGRFRRQEISLSTDAVRNSVLRDPTDVDDGRDHALQYNGRVLLSVLERDVPDSYVKVGFEGLCRNAANTRISGYLTLRSRVSEDDRGGEGYHLMRFRAARGPLFPVVQPAATAPAVVRSRVVKGSIRTITVNGRPELVADVRPQVLLTAGRRRTNMAVERLRLLDVAAIPRLRRASDKTSSERLTVPVMRSARMRVRLRSGLSATLTLPRVAPAPTIGHRTISAQASPEQWEPLAAAAGGNPGGSVPPVEPQRIKQLRLNAAAAYAAVRDGEVSREEDSPVAEALEETLRSTRRTRSIFGRATPASLSWSFLALDAQTGRRVAVRVNERPLPGDIGVRVRGQGLASTATVTFPNGGLYELRARVRMRDRYRRKGSASVRVSSVGLTGAEKAPFVTGLIRAAAILAGGSPDELASQAQAEPPTSEELADDPRARRARAIPALANDLARDRTVTLEELRSLVRAGRLWARTLARPTVDFRIW